MRTAAYRVPGLHVEEHRVTVPLDHSGAAPGELEVFARIVGDPAKPALLYLQGGPGHEAFRPARDNPAWLSRALEDYRVVMLDQRGTGQSSPVGHVDGAFVGTGGAQAPAQVAGFLTHFRADAIVNDAEVLRESLGIDQWAVLGQSFGGFTALRYLAVHPESLSLAMFTGGLPRVAGITGDSDLVNVYATTWAGMQSRSQRFFQAFPEDRGRFEALMARAESGISLPDGTVAGVEHVRGLGHLLGASGGAETLHWLLAQDVDSQAFRHDLLAALPFSARNPLYAVLQESCWADAAATRWAAVRARPAGIDPLWLAGEHVCPEVFASGPLSAWAQVAQELAAVEWPALWDTDSLRAAEVPTVAAVYYDDAYVPRDFSLKTASLLSNHRSWVTNEYEHNGLRASGSVVLDRLLAMAAGDV